MFSVRNVLGLGDGKRREGAWRGIRVDRRGAEPMEEDESKDLLEVSVACGEADSLVETILHEAVHPESHFTEESVDPRTCMVVVRIVGVVRVVFQVIREESRSELALLLERSQRGPESLVEGHHVGFGILDVLKNLGAIGHVHVSPHCLLADARFREASKVSQHGHVPINVLYHRQVHEGQPVGLHDVNHHTRPTGRDGHAVGGCVSDCHRSVVAEPVAVEPEAAVTALDQVRVPEERALIWDGQGVAVLQDLTPVPFRGNDAEVLILLCQDLLDGKQVASVIGVRVRRHPGCEWLSWLDAVDGIEQFDQLLTAPLQLPVDDGGETTVVASGVDNELFVRADPEGGLKQPNLD